VNAKAGIALAYLGTLFVLVLDSVPAVVGEIGESCWICLMVFLTLVSYVSSTVCIISAIKPHNFIAPIGIERSEIEAYLNMSRHNMLVQIIAQYSAYTQESLPVSKRKNRWFFVGLILAAVFTVCLLITQVLVGLL
jgi:hypothetical protein